MTEEWIVTPLWEYSISFDRDDHGNLVVTENDEVVTDEQDAIERYAWFGGVIGWPIMDLAEKSEA